MNKYKGLVVDYYMKNGQIITDDAFRFDEPMGETDKTLVDLVENIQEQVKKLMGHDADGYMVFGTVYVRSRECHAVRLTLVEEKQDGQ